MIANKPALEDRRVIVVSNRLPVSVTRRGGEMHITPSVGGLTTGLSSYHKQNDGIWVGWPGISPGSQKIKAELDETLQRDYNCLPVFLTSTDLKKYYSGFSNRTLWPLFHYFSTYCTYNPSEWESYKAVNQHFCDRVTEVAGEDDLIWVHDYHLLLLPGLLREKLPDATIGFFLHIPFPSMEIFRNLPWREELLKGMLGANLIGFHTYDYTRHFLSSILRILGKDQLYGQVIADNRMVKVDTFPMGIDADKFSKAASSAPVVKKSKVLAEKLNTEKVILSVDRLDFTKGIPEHLKAFELFLEKNPQWHGKITYVALCVPSRTKVKEYQLLKSEVDELVGRINGRFDIPGWLPILYMYRSLPFEELVALYRSADMALVTPLRDGMNLVAKEYLACHGENGKGVLILSETAGAAAELGEALIVNPNDIGMIADAIAEGLSMPDRDRQAALKLMNERISKYNIFRWTEDFISHLVEAGELYKQSKQRFLTDRIQNRAIEDYKKARKRLLLIDYDGTLVSFKKRPELASPDRDLLDLLAGMIEDPRNRIVIISGRDRERLEEWLADAGIDLVAEHGTWIRNRDDREWQLMVRGLSEDWKEQVRPILEMFSERTPGSFVEEKTYALVWHYRKAEPALGSLRSKELTDALHDILACTDLQVLMGNKVVEVKPANVNKGSAALNWIDNGEEWDFILAMGDDWTDEDIFAVLPEDAYSVKVGLAPFTRARYFLESPVQSRNFLEKLRDA